MNTEHSNDLVSISIDTLARVTGGRVPDSEKKDIGFGGSRKLSPEEIAAFGGGDVNRTETQF